MYPTIDPNEAFAKQTYQGKVIFVIGASGHVSATTKVAHHVEAFKESLDSGNDKDNEDESVQVMS